jgi:tyrosine-protein kinase
LAAGDGPRYKTLRDYLRVLRAHRLLIAGMTLLFAGAAFAISSRAAPSYGAEALMSCTDPVVDENTLGGSGFPRRTPELEASVCAQRVTRIDIAEAVKERLDTRLTPGELLGMVEAARESRTNLVAIKATAGEPELAAQVANAFARETARAHTADERGRYREAARSLRSRFRRQATARNTPIVRAQFEERVARLESLGQFARPVEIVERAEPAATATSPSPARNAVLAGLVGLTLGIAAAFLRDALDIRLREPGQIQSEVGLPLMACVSRDALGAAGCLPGAARRLPSADAEAFRILRRNADFIAGGSRVRSIAVTSAVPEEGKSTVAASLAWAQAAAGRRTLLIECDLRRPTLAKRLNVKPTPGLTDYLTGKAEFPDVVRGLALERHPPVNGNGKAPGHLLEVVTAGSPSHGPAELLETSSFKDFVATAARSYDQVILDTGPLLPVADTLEVLEAVDAVVVCVRASRTTRDQASAARRALGVFRDKPAGLVVTGVREDRYPAYGYEGYEEKQPAGVA